MPSGGLSTSASAVSLNSSAKARRAIEEVSCAPLVRLVVAVGGLLWSDAAVGYCRAFTGGIGFAHSTSRSTTTGRVRWTFGSGGAPRRPRTDCRMAVTPIGPFCPFRSEAAVQLDPKMSRLNTATPDFATDMARIQLDMETGKMPEPSKLISVATSMEEAVDEWEDLLTRLRLSDDFQTKEYSKLTQAHLERHGQSTEGIGKMMRWQSACMKAMATNSPPPPPPSDLNLMEMVSRAREQQERSGEGGDAAKPPPSMSAMASASYITSTPFKGTEAAFDSPTVREEYERLCRDHAALIEMGGGYAKFDPAGKIAFLDEIEKVEERWDVFFARFSLLGALDEQFSEECDAFLEGMGLDEPDFRDLLRRAHALMREDAERERNMNYS